MKTDVDAKKRERWQRWDEARGNEAVAEYLEHLRFLMALASGKMKSRDWQTGKLKDSTGKLLDHLIPNQERLAGPKGPFPVPDTALQFFAQLIEGRKGRNVLDPSGEIGLLGAWIADRLPDRHVDVCSPYPWAHEIGEGLGLQNLTLNAGCTWRTTETLADTYDAIISIPPINRPDERRTYGSGPETIRLVDDPALFLVTDLAPRLSVDGFFAVVVLPRFPWDQRTRKTVPRLRRDSAGPLRRWLPGWRRPAADTARRTCRPRAR